MLSCLADSVVARAYKEQEYATAGSAGDGVYDLSLLFVVVYGYALSYTAMRCRIRLCVVVYGYALSFMAMNHSRL